MAVEFDASAYTRLPGHGRRLSGRFITGEAQWLYMSGDHLLVLRRVGYEETSKKIALNDIQAITLQSNGDRAVVSASLVFVMMMITALGLFAIAQEVEPTDLVMVLLYIVLGIMGIFLAWNLALGPTCTVRMHTAVQIEELTALRRLRVTQRCLAILVPRIEAVQGAWPQGAPALQALAGHTVRVSANAKRIVAKKTPKAIGRSLHAAAFAFSIALGLSLIVELGYESAVKDIVDTVLVSASTLLLLIAAIRQANTSLPGQTQALTWALFLVNGMAYMGTMFTLSFVMAFTAAASGGVPPDMMTGVVTLGQEDPEWFDVMVAVWGGVSLLLGLFGLISIRGYRLVERRSPDDPGAPSL